MQLGAEYVPRVWNGNPCGTVRKPIQTCLFGLFEEAVERYASFFMSSISTKKERSTESAPKQGQSSPSFLHPISS